MNIQTPQQKADELMQQLDDVHSAIRVCDKMIEGNIVNCASYYQQVKEILIKNKSNDETN